MKYEETSDISTILMEPADEAAFVLDWITERCHPARPLVLLLPVNASQLFGHPDALYALRQLQSERVGTILLVIPGNAGNERLRSWAAQQGFPVFATVETCTGALAQHGPLSVQQHAVRGALSPTRRVLRPSAVAASAMTSLEPSVSGLRTTDALQRHPARQERVAVTRKNETEPLILRDGPTATRIELRKRQDTFMLILVILLILGILGGVGFGYLLTLVNHVPQAVSPAAWQLIQLSL